MKLRHHRRTSLLGDDDALRQRAEDVGETVPKLRSLLTANIAAARNAIERLDEYLWRPDIAARRAAERMRAKAIVFEDIPA